MTIIKDDNAVVIDGVHHKVDCGALPADFHALQWTDLEGEIEHRMMRCDHCGARSKKPNQVISDLAPYQKYVDAWHVAETAAAEKLVAK